MNGLQQREAIVRYPMYSSLIIVQIFSNGSVNSSRPNFILETAVMCSSDFAARTVMLDQRDCGLN